MCTRMIAAFAAVVGLGCTAVGQTQYEEAKLSAGPDQWYGQFGSAVAIDSDTIIVGAPYDDANDIPFSGSAYIFVRSGDLWVRQAKLTPSDAAEQDFFGVSVAISGETAVIGAYKDDDNGAESGSAYVFVRNGGVWTQQAKLVPSDGAAEDEFGRSVGISGDRVVVGAYKDDDNDLDSGSAYVFVRSGGVWTQQTKLIADDGERGESFGFAVAIDGDTAVIGAYQDDDNDIASGSIYVYTHEAGVWSLQAKVMPEDGYFFDWFGYAVDIDGDTIVAGAPRKSNIGAAYTFVRDGSSWSQQAKMMPEDGAGADQFAYAVAISGEEVVVGSWFSNHSGEDSGAAYAFKRVGTAWMPYTLLLPSDGAAYDNFGCSASLDQGTAIVGARYESEDGPYAGAAYVFGLCRVDFNGDGTVNTQDFLAYLNAFVAGESSADFNGDGIVNIQDFLAFLNAFVAGC